MATEEIAISAHKMKELCKMIWVRSKATNVPFLPFIELFAEKINELHLAEEKLDECCDHQKERYEDEYEFANIRVALCSAVLVNFFYPVIEQMEKVVDDGITLQK